MSFMSSVALEENTRHFPSLARVDRKETTRPGDLLNWDCTGGLFQQALMIVSLNKNMF